MSDNSSCILRELADIAEGRSDPEYGLFCHKGSIQIVVYHVNAADPLPIEKLVPAVSCLDGNPPSLGGVCPRSISPGWSCMSASHDISARFP